MEMALGWLHITPDAFWRMTLREFEAAVEGYVETVDGGKSRREAANLERLADLIERTPAKSRSTRK